MQHPHSFYRSTASSHDQLQLVRVRVFVCLCVCGMACLVNAALTSLGLDVAHKRHKPERAHQRGVHARPEERTCVRLRIPPSSPVAVRQPCGRRMLFGRRLVRRVEDPHLSAHSRTHARTRGHCHCLPGPSPNSRAQVAARNGGLVRKSHHELVLARAGICRALRLASRVAPHDVALPHGKRPCGLLDREELGHATLAEHGLSLHPPSTNPIIMAAPSAEARP